MILYGIDEDNMRVYEQVTGPVSRHHHKHIDGVFTVPSDVQDILDTGDYAVELLLEDAEDEVDRRTSALHIADALDHLRDAVRELGCAIGYQQGQEDYIRATYQMCVVLEEAVAELEEIPLQKS